jgi:hypothetical protein
MLRAWFSEIGQFARGIARPSPVHAGAGMCNT